MTCIFDESLEPYWCEADWNCKDCPNWIDGQEPQEDDWDKLDDIERSEYMRELAERSEE